MKRRYGWKPDLPDQRDYQFAPRLAAGALPAHVDLRPGPAIFDQGPLGSCTANAIASAFQWELQKQKARSIIPSRLFLYYNERALEGTVYWDAGAYIRDGFKSLAAQGICLESEWPYLPAKFANRPKPACYTSALKHQSLQYSRLSQTLDQMRQCLAAGFPFTYGFSVYESFESEEVAKSGIIPMPESQETLLGGHAVLAVGYDESSQRFLTQNSWGTTWGQKGYFTIPYAYLTNSNLASDFWTLRLVEG